MALLSCSAAVLAWLLPAAQEEDPLGERVVESEQATIYKTPKRSPNILRPAEFGEIVTVTAVEGYFVKVRLADGREGYMSPSTLVPKGKFKISSSDEAKVKRLQAQGFEAQRGFDEQTERKYRQEGGDATDKAYQEVDALEKRPAVRLNRARLEEALLRFREEGKLGEFASVK